MVPPPGRVGDTVKLLVHVCTCPEAIAMVDACAAALRQQRAGAAFSRAEALRSAALEWLKARQARGTPAPSPRAPAAAPALEAAAAPAAPEPGPGGPPPPAEPVWSKNASCLCAALPLISCHVFLPVVVAP